MIRKMFNFNLQFTETIFCLKPKKSVIHPYYLMYALYTQSAKNQFEPRISKGSVPHLKVKDLLEVKIPVPNMKEQKRIINLMRKFDSLCNNISQGLPAEIAARQKQYEYYRDKLLTFKKLS
ncbi:MAG: restriction endonuclease subunit S [Selenomonadaceae bacterium]|nr:restriction endonuclease subunit S [Selenomonadaceae bacterium]